MSPGSTPIVKEEESIQMSAKGASYRYGNTKGANHRGEATIASIMRGLKLLIEAD